MGMAVMLHGLTAKAELITALFYKRSYTLHARLHDTHRTHMRHIWAWL